jgi:hypothetical protein
MPTVVEELELIKISLLDICETRREQWTPQSDAGPMSKQVRKGVRRYLKMFGRMKD